MKRSNVSVFICLFLLYFCQTQSGNQSNFSKLERSFQRNKIRGFILERADWMAAGKYLGGCVGYECEQPDESVQYTFISQFAKSEELNELLYHPSGLVRCYALDALMEKGKFNYYQVLKEKLSDESEVLEAHGCEVFPIKVRDYYYNRLSDKISKSEKKEIDLLILNSRNSHDVKKSLSEEKHKPAGRKK
ncbi:MAG TPA: hypothetical protein PL169_09055 [Leptospiraceae bacterium]|nr:hypothetical protein [Leptospiraceae bacterium]